MSTASPSALSRSDSLTELIRVTRPERSAALLTVGPHELFFLAGTLHAFTFEDMVYTRDDLPRLPQQRRALNRWRRFDSQTPIDRYSFLLILEDAFKDGLREVKKELSNGE